MHRREKLFIGGSWVSPSAGDTFEVISPHTETPIAVVAAAGAADVDTAVTGARAAFDNGPWPRLDPADRIEAVRRLAKIYVAQQPAMAELITAEIGAPIGFAQRAQVGLPSMMMNAFCDLAERFGWRGTRRGFYGGRPPPPREP